MSSPLTRKQFLRASLLGGAASLIAVPGGLRAQSAASANRTPGSNSDIRVAVVGVRAQGAGHMKTYYQMPGARLVAICDADAEILQQRAADAAKEGINVATYLDYRKLLEDSGVDAVVIATPNHWHSLMTIWALEAGKDVFVEKPLSHNIWEGRQAVEAARYYKKQIVQAGTQNRSSLDIRKAMDFIRSGQLGKITHVRGLCYKRRESIGRAQGPQAVPASINYDLWTGPADLVPPHRNGSRGPVHYDWHWFWNYGGGDISNQGIHQVDVARWFLGEDGLPRSVFSIGGRFGEADDAETPNTEISVFDYATAPLIFEVRGLPMRTGMNAMDNYRGARVGVIVHCEGGYVHISEAGNVAIYDAAGKKLATYTEGGLAGHRTNFIDAVRARDQSLARGHILNSHVSTNLCHLGNVSYLLGQERSSPAVAEAIASDALTKEAFDRTLDHLKANSIDVGTTPMVLGPLLTIDAAAERIAGPTPEIAAKANANLLIKRTGRKGFTVPTYAGRA
jgi:predicted dehydrogenase